MATTTQALGKSGKAARRGIDPLNIVLAIAAIVILGLLILDLTLLPASKPAAQPTQPQSEGQEYGPSVQQPAEKAPTVVPTAGSGSSYGDY